jgi:putative hemolysin
MLRIGSRNQFLTILIMCLFCVVVLGCTRVVDETPAGETPTPEIAVPAEVAEAREAVLSFLRDGANECVPPVGVLWHAAAGKAPQGFAVYRFHAEECAVTVSYQVTVEEPLYHVALHSGDTGFCWQANVNSQARVVDTGTAAELVPELASVAAAYCRAQDYEYEVQEQPDGSRCGVCTFPDGSQCKAWLFYQGECKTPEEAVVP